ncbi:MAG: DUF4097 domain-containing protein [Anaeroplasmataceae bacterium]|nr:DUF4097 domain-containing protein [Anaeroplasmataceae bacterium]
MEKNINTGFTSIHLEAAHTIIIKRGISFKCSAEFSINDGRLYASSGHGNITLIIPNFPLEEIVLQSNYGSIKCEEIATNSIQIYAPHDIKIKKSNLKICKIISQYGALNIIKSTISNLQVQSAHDIKLSLFDFTYLHLQSEYGIIRLKYFNTTLVNVNAKSEYGSVKVNGNFYGDDNCKKTIVAHAAHDIKLENVIGKNSNEPTSEVYDNEQN